MSNETKTIPANWRVQECHEVDIFNGSYMIVADDPRGFPDEEIVICRLPTGCGEFSEQYPHAKLIAAAPAMFETLERIAEDPETPWRLASLAKQAIKLTL